MAHKSESELVKIIEHAKSQVKIGEDYIHYKSPDKTYTVLDAILIEETDEAGIVYQPNYGMSLKHQIMWMRPLSNFLAEVELDSGKKVPRFRLVSSKN